MVPKAGARDTFRRALLDWYADHGRDLPWRRFSNPYRVLVSECMLQQTQVDRVIPKYHAFLEQFPDVESLARATKGDVLRAWSGLGYNSRALRLQQFAQAVMERFSGEIPADIPTLRSLPGIGPYTAGAIRTFGHGLPSAFVDVNIARILQRVFLGADGLAETLSPRQTEELAAALAPEDVRANPYHQALMDVGATLCKARDVHCDACPLRTLCRARPTFEAEPLHLAEHRKKTRRPKEPFVLSLRFLRGRIIHLLREHPEGLTERILFTMLQNLGVPNLERLFSTLVSLEEEGLLHRQGDRYLL